MSMKINYQSGIMSAETGSSYTFAGSKAQNQVLVRNWEELASETLTVNGTALIQNTHWTAATNNETTAASIVNAVNTQVTGVSATTDNDPSGNIYLEVDAVGSAGNAYTLTTTDTTYLQVENATFFSGFDAVPATDIGTNCIKFGEKNTIDSLSSDCGIVSSGSNQLIDTDHSYIIGGDTNLIAGGAGNNHNLMLATNTSKIIKGVFSGIIIGGDTHLISDDDYAVILGGFDCKITGNGTYSSIINSYRCTIAGSNYLATMVGSSDSSINTSQNWCGIYSCGNGEIWGDTGYGGIIFGEAQRIGYIDYYSCIVGGSDNEIYAAAGYSGIFASYNVFIGDVYGAAAINVEGGYIIGNDTLCYGYNVATEQNRAFVQANSSTTIKAQNSRMVYRVQTTTSTPIYLIPVKISRLTSSGTNAVNACFAVTVEMASMQYAGTAGTVGDSCFKKYELLVKNLNGTCSQVGSTTTTAIAYDAAASGWGLTFAIDDTNDELDISFTGETDKSIQTTTSITCVEVAK